MKTIGKTIGDNSKAIAISLGAIVVAIKGLSFYMMFKAFTKLLSLLVKIPVNLAKIVKLASQIPTILGGKIPNGRPETIGIPERPQRREPIILEHKKETKRPTKKGGYSRHLRRLNGVGAALNIGGSVYEAISSTQNNEDTDFFTPEMIDTIGASIGGVLGASLGGLAGSVVPVYGTTLGATAGSFAGAEMGESVARFLREAFGSEPATPLNYDPTGATSPQTFNAIPNEIKQIYKPIANTKPQPIDLTNTIQINLDGSILDQRIENKLLEVKDITISSMTTSLQA